jgi:hypothetical protein
VSIWSETLQSPHELLDALRRDAANPRAWHAPTEAIAAIEKLTGLVERKQGKLRPPADGEQRARRRGSFHPVRKRVPYGSELEREIRTRRAAGEPASNIASSLGLSESTVDRVVARKKTR